MRKTKLLMTKVRIRGELFWRVTVPKLGSGRTRKTFRDGQEAQSFLELCRVQQDNYGTAALSISESLRIEAVECAQRLGEHGKALRDATEHYLAHLNAVAKSCNVRDVVTEFVRAKSVDGASKRYLGDLRVRLAKFCSVFGGKVIAAIEAREIASWLHGLNVGAVTRNTFRRRLAALFNFARKQGYLSQSPIPDVDKAKECSEEIGILSPAQVARLLENADRDTLPYWAIGAFCGLRSAELERLKWSDVEIDAEEGFVEVKARNSKTASRRIVPVAPNLRQWLQPYRRNTGPVCPNALRKQIEADRARAGLLAGWPQNALRHGYGSYRLAQCQDAAKVSLEMGNSPAMVFRHYRELVRPTSAHLFWSIVPKGGAQICQIAAA